jgi:hypothetical protein
MPGYRAFKTRTFRKLASLAKEVEADSKNHPQLNRILSEGYNPLLKFNENGRLMLGMGKRRVVYDYSKRRITQEYELHDPMHETSEDNEMHTKASLLPVDYVPPIDSYQVI